MLLGKIVVFEVTKPESFRSWWDMRDRQIDTFPKFTYPLMMLLAQDMNFRLVLLLGNCVDARRKN